MYYSFSILLPFLSAATLVAATNSTKMEAYSDRRCVLGSLESHSFRDLTKSPHEDTRWCMGNAMHINSGRFWSSLGWVSVFLSLIYFLFFSYCSFSCIR